MMYHNEYMSKKKYLTKFLLVEPLCYSYMQAADEQLVS
jgi:hypothetical protein